MTTPDLLPQAALCAAPGCRRGPSLGLLCVADYAELANALTRLADDLTASPDVKIGGWSTGATSGGPLKSERDPINLRLIDAQRQAPPVLEAWAVWLCARRTDLTRGGGAAGDRTLLASKLDWIRGQPEITQFWCQLLDLSSSLRGHLPIRSCTCGGPVWSQRGRGGWCPWCTTAWAGSELLKLGRPGVAA